MPPPTTRRICRSCHTILMESDVLLWLDVWICMFMCSPITETGPKREQDQCTPVWQDSNRCKVQCNSGQQITSPPVLWLQLHADGVGTHGVIQNIALNYFHRFSEKKESVHYHHQKKIFWRTFLALKKNFPGRWWIQKHYKNQESHIYHRNLSSVVPIFSAKKSSALEQGGECFLFPRILRVKWSYAKSCGTTLAFKFTRARHRSVPFLAAAAAAAVAAAAAADPDHPLNTPFCKPPIRNTVCYSLVSTENSSIRCAKKTREDVQQKNFWDPQDPPLEILCVGLFPVAKGKEAPNMENLRGQGSLGRVSWRRVSGEILYVYALFWFLNSMQNLGTPSVPTPCALTVVMVL